MRKLRSRAMSPEEDKMKKLFLLLISLALSAQLCAECPCEGGDSYGFKDASGETALALCAGRPVQDNACYSPSELSLFNCATGENILDSSGGDVFRLEWGKDAVYIYRFKKLLATPELVPEKVTITAYKVIANRKGSYDVILLRVMSIPTMPDSRWEEVLAECRESLEKEGLSEETMARVMFASLAPVGGAETLFLSLGERIAELEKDSPDLYLKLSGYYEELKEAHDIYNARIPAKGKKIFKGRVGNHPAPAPNG